MESEESISYWKKLWLLFYTFAKIAALVVGGGYAILPVVEETFSRKNKLISSEELLDMMALVQTIPGIIAANSAIYVGMKIADNDMNTWEPITPGTAQFLKNATHVIWRTEMNLRDEYEKNGGIILFKSMAGRAEVWLDGKLIAKKEDVNERDFKAEFGPVDGPCELRVLLYSSPNTHVGLKGTIKVQSR